MVTLFINLMILIQQDEEFKGLPITVKLMKCELVERSNLY